jgi:hypothetical protein
MKNIPASMTRKAKINKGLRTGTFCHFVRQVGKQSAVAAPVRSLFSVGEHVCVK